MPDGVVLARKIGAGAVRRPVPVALGILPDGRKGIIDLQPARGESAAEWERPPARLPPPALPHRRGPPNDPRRRRQWFPRCTAPRPSGHPRPALPGPQDQEHPRQTPQARPGGCQTRPPRHHERPEHHRRVHRRTPPLCRPVVGAPPEGRRMPARRPRDLPARFRYPTPDGRRRVRTTNAIERRFREVRRRTRPMGTFRDRTSMERVLFAIFSYRNKKTEPPPLTQRDT